MLTKAEIQRLKELADTRGRREAGRFIVEGPKVIDELVRERYPLLEVFALDSWTPAAPLVDGTQLTRVGTAEMARISHYPTPSAVLAVAAIPDQPAVPELDGWSLALDGIQDPGNVGTLVRIADWFGMRRVLLSTATADAFSQKAINASMGSFARVPVWRGPLHEVLQGSSGLDVIGCDLEGEPLQAFSPRSRGVVVIGSEGQGLSPTLSALLTHKVTIPRIGKAESLNAAVAAGIVCAHCRLQ